MHFAPGEILKLLAPVTPTGSAEEEEERKEGHLGPEKESDVRRDLSKYCSGCALNPDDGQECTGFSNQRAWQSEQDQGVMSGEVSLRLPFSRRARAEESGRMRSEEESVREEVGELRCTLHG